MPVVMTLIILFCLLAGDGMMAGGEGENPGPGLGNNDSALTARSRLNMLCSTLAKIFVSGLQRIWKATAQ